MKTIHFVMTGPPAADAGSFVKIVDDSGNPVDVGWWQHDESDGLWHYIMPVRMVPELMVEQGQDGPSIDEATSRHIRRTEPLRLPSDDLDPGQAGRAALREKLKGRQAAAAPKTIEPPAPTPIGHIPAPCCGTPYNPADELLDCGNCGEGKCAKCLPNAVKPCVDCAALAASKEENEFVGDGPDAGSAAPPAGRLFDGQFHPDPKAVARAAAEGTEIQDDEDEG